METLRPASDGPPGRALRRGLTVLGLVLVVGLLAVAVASANPGVILVFDQCANDQGAGPCKWINGDLNQQNSRYRESDAVPERFLYEAQCVNGTGGDETLTLRYQTTNSDPSGAKHAYDYLTNVDHTETYVTQPDLAQLCSGLGNNATVAQCLSWPVTYFGIPHDPNLPNGWEQPQANRTFIVLNGAISAVSTPVIFSGDYTKDSLTQMTLTFHATCPAGYTGAQQVLVGWGAHVAAESDWCPGTGGCGAFNIRGSPYHMMTINGGSRDNQMQANAISGNLPEVTVCKQVLGPPTTHVFQFTKKASPGDSQPVQFGLAADQCKSYSGLPLNGNITFLELFGTSEYIFRRVDCVNAPGSVATWTTTGNTTGTGISVDLKSSADDVTCTFVNALSTAVKLASFNGRAVGGKVQLEWQTGTETNNAGFNVLRATSAAGPYVKVNKQLIGATGDAVAGASYSFKDKPEKYGKFFYKLEDVDMSGKATAHGPVDVTVAWPFVRPSFQPAAPGQ